MVMKSRILGVGIKIAKLTYHFRRVAFKMVTLSGPFKLVIVEKFYWHLSSASWYVFPFCDIMIPEITE